MNSVLHITSGDFAGTLLSRSGLYGDILVWHDILYEGPRKPGWPQDDVLEARARFLEETTGGGLNRVYVLETLKDQYRKLAAAADYSRIVLWFDACLFDQSMLAHILTCLVHQGLQTADLLCIDRFPGIEPFNGLGQLQPVDFVTLYGGRRPATPEQYAFAQIVDRAFADQDLALFNELAGKIDTPLPWVPAAVARWLQERPDAATGLGRLEAMALAAICQGCDTPAGIFAHAAAHETPPQYWGDITLWAKINALADHDPPLVKIDGPMARLPQWENIADLSQFRIHCLVESGSCGHPK
jgi:hypothetical protein